MEGRCRKSSNLSLRGNFGGDPENGLNVLRHFFKGMIDVLLTIGTLIGEDLLGKSLPRGDSLLDLRAKIGRDFVQGQKPRLPRCDRILEFDLKLGWDFVRE